MDDWNGLLDKEENLQNKRRDLPFNCYGLPVSYNIQTSGGQVPNSQSGGPGSTSEQTMWNFGCMKCN
jgi:hypothetical protein